MERKSPSPALHVSPLDSLVRRASSRRAKNKDALNVPATPPRSDNDPHAHPHGAPWHQSPVSPLLHTQFRTSVASTSISAYDAKSLVSESSLHPDGFEAHPHPHRGSHSSQATTTTARQVSMASQYSVPDAEMAALRDSYSQPRPAPSPSPSPMPTVVVSPEWPPPPMIPSPSSSHAGRVPSRLPPGTANFSRPVTLSQSYPSPQSYSPTQQLPPQSLPPSQPPPPPPPTQPQPQHSKPPRPPITGSEEQKRQVLMRHAHNSSGASGTHTPNASAGSLPRAPALRPSSSATESVYSNYSYYPYDGAQSPAATSPVLSSEHLSPQVQARPSPGMASPLQLTPAQPQPQAKQGRARSQTLSARSPTTSSPNPTSPISPSSPCPAASASAPPDPQTPQDYLTLGIAHHLANRLPESAAAFEAAATLDGGCGVGMLMWGLAQRHGWGVPKDEDKGFRWLRRAAEMAVGDLEKAGAGKGEGGVERGAVKSELVLAIYEVGQSFFRGWGVEKDKKMAVSYFQLAAKLGDPDAQQDLAFCLANGKGCKKDRKEAARWYRAAVAQGASDIGLAWIYKEKFQ